MENCIEEKQNEKANINMKDLNLQYTLKCVKIYSCLTECTLKL